MHFYLSSGTQSDHQDKRKIQGSEDAKGGILEYKSFLISLTSNLDQEELTA